MKFKLPYLLLGIYIVFFILLGIHPYDRSVWIAEMAPIVLIVLVLTFTYRSFQFSNFAYILMSFLIFLHTIGGHYSFERVPFGFVTNLFGFTRNHFDRMSHFTVGFYAYGIGELLLRNKRTNSKWVLFLFPVFAIFTVAAVYEIMEWIYAANAAAEQGTAFLGSQGDIWDAQEDMLSDGLGALFIMGLFWIFKRKYIRSLN